MNTEVSTLVRQMATQSTYDEAWAMALEVHSLVDQSTATAVFEALFADDNHSQPVRRAAAFWLTDDAEHVSPTLLQKMAHDPDDEVRFHAAYCLSYAKHHHAVETLRELLCNDVAEDVRQTAAQSIYAAAKLNDVDDNVILDDFSQVLTEDSSAKVREEVVISLADFLKSPQLQRATTLLEKTLNDVSAKVREQATISLSVLRDEVWHHNDPVLHPEER